MTAAAIALLGTSADPPTRGHQVLLEGLLNRYGQVATWASDNPLKQHDAPLELRAMLLGQLVQQLQDERLELAQHLSSPYTLITLQRAAQHWPDRNLVFVVGSDLAGQIPRWKQSDCWLPQCRLAIAPRKGWPSRTRRCRPCAIWADRWSCWIWRFPPPPVRNCASNRTKLRSRNRCGRCCSSTISMAFREASADAHRPGPTQPRGRRLRGQREADSGCRAQGGRTAGVELVLTPELSLWGYPPRDQLLEPSRIQQQDTVLQWLVNQLNSSVTLLVGAALPASDARSPRLHNGVVLVNRLGWRPIAQKQLLPSYDVFDERRYFRPGDGPCLLTLPNGEATGPHHLRRPLGG